MKKIGNAIKRIRTANKLSQNDMAKELGVSRQAVSNWERGLTYPDVEMLNRISRIYDISIDRLMDGKIVNISSDRNLNLVNNMLLLINFVLYIYLITRGSSVVFLSIYLICSIPTYLMFLLIIKTGSYSMLSGYDSKVKYNEQSLKRHILELGFGILIVTIFQYFLELLLSFISIDTGGIKVILLLTYVISFTTVIIVINIRNKNKISM